MLSSHASAFWTMIAGAIDKEPKLFKPVLLFLREENKPSTAIATLAQHIKVFTLRHNRKVLFGLIRSDSGRWKIPRGSKLIDPECRGLRKLNTMQRRRLAVTGMWDKVVSRRQQFACSLNVELSFPSRLRKIVGKNVGQFGRRSFRATKNSTVTKTGSFSRVHVPGQLANSFRRWPQTNSFAEQSFDEYWQSRIGGPARQLMLTFSDNPHRTLHFPSSLTHVTAIPPTCF